jgi:hypothetical protein
MQMVNNEIPGATLFEANIVFSNQLPGVPNTNIALASFTQHDTLAHQTPSLALNQAAREELRLLDEIKLMRTVWMMIWGKNVRLVSKSRSIKGALKGLKRNSKIT